MQCPVCDYPAVLPYQRLPDRFFQAVEGRFALYRCPSCRLILQDEAEVASRLGEFYPSGYWWRPSGKVSRLEGSYRNWVLRLDQLRFLTRVAPPTPGTRMLDIGCGNATLVRAALEAGYDAYGLEQSAEACQTALQNAPGRIIQADEAALAAQGEKFDVVTMFHTLEHLPQPFQYLRKLQKLLRLPGSLIVQVPNTESWQARLYGGRWYGLDCPRHLYNYNPYALLHLLGRAGYRVHRVRHFSLRDNAAGWVSSLFPFLDPMSQRVKLLRRTGRRHSLGLALREAAYLPLLLKAQPIAWLEAAFRRGGSITVHATLEEKP